MSKRTVCSIYKVYVLLKFMVSLQSKIWVFHLNNFSRVIRLIIIIFLVFFYLSKLLFSFNLKVIFYVAKMTDLS